jgi:hypothetical protein
MVNTEPSAQSDRMLTVNDSGGRNSVGKLECLDPVATRSRFCNRRCLTDGSGKPYETL